MKHTTVKVGSVDLMVQEFGARAKSKLLSRLGRVIGPALAKAPTELTDSTNVSDIAPAFAQFCAALDDKAQDELFVSVLCSSQVVAGKEVFALDTLEKIDRAVGADLGLLYRLLWAVLEANFGDFTGGLQQSALGQLLRAAMANAASPST